MFIPFAQPWLAPEDRDAIGNVLRGTVLTQGDQLQAFESEFSAFVGDSANCVAVSSCMAALHLAYLLLGIGNQDEVILPAQTHVATAHAVELVGAKPIFVDCELETGNLKVDQLELAITKRTRAVCVLHFLGIPARMSEIAAFAASHRLALVEDCALALGSRRNGEHVGMLGDVGCFSFYPTKHITTGEGGMLVTKHKEIADRARVLRSFGVKRQAGHPNKYDVDSVGFNYRLTEMASALGRSQLGRIRQNLMLRQEHFSALATALAKVPYISVLGTSDSDTVTSHYCLCVLLHGPLAHVRDAIMSRLRNAGVGSSIYYPHPVPRLQYYRAKYGWDPRKYYNAQLVSDCTIALPVGPTLSDADCSFIAEAFAAACAAELC
jgi:perosamine synthetase